MSWFNYYGLVIMVIIMIPNIVYAVCHKNSAVGVYDNKAAVIAEQIGRYGCFALMVFNIPYTYFGFYFTFGQAVYLIVNAVLLAAYCLIWIILRNKSGMVKAVLLSVIPSVIFVFSAVMIVSIPLLVFAVVFAAAHILISVKSVPSENGIAKKER